jgi:hypothetical protein
MHKKIIVFCQHIDKKNTGHNSTFFNFELIFARNDSKEITLYKYCTISEEFKKNFIRRIHLIFKITAP